MMRAAFRVGAALEADAVLRTMANHIFAADGAFFFERIIPRYEIALRIMGTAIEDRTSSAFFLQNFAAADRTRRWDDVSYGLCVFTGRVIRASDKFAVSAHFIDHFCAAFFAVAAVFFAVFSACRSSFA